MLAMVSELPELTRAASPSVVEDRQVELAKALGVGDQVDLDDLPARDREAEYDTGPFKIPSGREASSGLQRSTPPPVPRSTRFPVRVGADDPSDVGK
jgi:hypothetical protein